MKLISCSWIYRLFIGIDANFRMRRKDVSSDTRDPGLNRGFAYFVEDGVYDKILATRKNDDEVRVLAPSNVCIDKMNTPLTDQPLRLWAEGGGHGEHKGRTWVRCERCHSMSMSTHANSAERRRDAAEG